MLVTLVGILAGGIAYGRGWIGLALVAVLPLAALTSLVTVAVAAARGRIAWSTWRIGTGTQARAMPWLATVTVVRACCWLGLGVAAYASLPRSTMSAEDAQWGVVSTVGSVLVLLIVTAVPMRRRLRAVTALLVVGGLFAGWQMIKLADPPDPRVALGSPVSGRWVITSGGNSALVNHHYPLVQQRHAIDLSMPYDHTGVGSRNRLEQFPAFGQPARAASDGRVVRIVDDQPDQQVGVMDPDHPLGNYVVVRIRPRTYVLMAHLRADSITVAEGQEVRAGQQLAEVGNSGNSSEPHLHLQVQTARDLLDDTGQGWADITTLPIEFDDATDPAGQGTEGRVPRTDDVYIFDAA